MKRALAIAAMAAALVVIIAGLAWDRHRINQTIERAEASPAQAAPTSRPVEKYVTVIGDSFTTGSDMGGYGEKNWTSLVAKNLASSSVYIKRAAIGGTGYAMKNSQGKSFSDSLAGVRGGEKAVVIFGSVNDVPGDGLTAAVTKLISDVKAKAPQATVVAVGPAFTGDLGTPRAATVNAQTRTGAEAAGVRYVDASDWFAGHTDLIGSDQVHPTDAGHALLADRLTPVVQTAIE